jgi:hypothetical protein
VHISKALRHDADALQLQIMINFFEDAGIDSAGADVQAEEAFALVRVLLKIIWKCPVL